MIEIQPHQKTAVRHLFKKCIKQNGLMVYWRMGTGKTIGTWTVVAKYAEKVKNLKVLIVCGEQLVQVWKSEKEKLKIDDKNLKIEFMTYKDFLGSQIKEKKQKSFLVIDEVHNILPYIQDERTNDLNNFYANCRQFEKKMFLSGTPISNSAFDILHYINACADEFIFPTNERLFNEQFKKKRFVKGTVLMLIKFILDIWKYTGNMIYGSIAIASFICKHFDKLPQEATDYFNKFKITKFVKPVLAKLNFIFKFTSKVNSSILLTVYHNMLYLKHILTKGNGTFKKNTNFKTIYSNDIKDIFDLKFQSGPNVQQMMEDTKKCFKIIGLIMMSGSCVDLLIKGLTFLITKQFYINKERINQYYNLNKKKVVKFSQKYVSYVDIPDNLKERFPKMTEKTVKHKYTLKQMDLFLKYVKGNISPKDYKQLDISVPENYPVNFHKLLDEKRAIYEHGLKIGNIYNTPKFQFILENIKSNRDKKIAIYSNFVKTGGLLLSQFLKDNNIDHLFLTDAKDVSTFNGKKTNVIILHPKFSEGLSLLKVRYFHILEMPETLSKYEQIKARVNRLDSHASLDEKDQNCTIFTHVMESNPVLRKVLGFNKWITDIDFWKSSFLDQHLHSVHKFEKTPDQITLNNINNSVKFRNEILDTLKKFTIENMTEEDYNKNCI